MVQIESTVRNVVIAASLAMGSSGKGHEPTVLESTPVAVPTRSVIEELQQNETLQLPQISATRLYLPQLSLTGSITEAGLTTDIRYTRITIEQSLLNQIPAYERVISPEFLTLSFNDQSREVGNALADVRKLNGTISKTHADKGAINSIESELENLDQLYNGLLAIEPQYQSMAFDVLQQIGKALEVDDRTLELSKSRGSLKDVIEWSSVLTHGLSKADPFCLARDAHGKTVLEHLHRLLEKDRSPRTVLLAIDILLDLDRPDMAGFQTSYPHCPSGGIHNFVVTNLPGEYARQVVELYMDGETTFRSKKVCSLDTEAIDENHLTRRSSSGTIFQSSLMRYGAADGSERTKSRLQVGLNSEDVQRLSSDYFGRNYQWVKGVDAAAVILEKEPLSPVFGGFSNFERSGANSGHFVTFLEVTKERFYFRDSNGNYGLHPHGWNIFNAEKGETPKWHWGGCTEAGENPLPVGLIPMLIQSRGEKFEILFANSEHSIPEPGFIRHSPERRMETWNSGKFSIERSELEKVNPMFLIPMDLIEKHFRPVEQPAEPAFSLKRMLWLGLTFGATFWAVNKVLSWFRRNENPSAPSAEPTGED